MWRYGFYSPMTRRPVDHSYNLSMPSISFSALYVSRCNNYTWRVFTYRNCRASICKLRLIRVGNFGKIRRILSSRGHRILWFGAASMELVRFCINSGLVSIPLHSGIFIPHFLHVTCKTRPSLSHKFCGRYGGEGINLGILAQESGVRRITIIWPCESVRMSWGQSSNPPS